MIALVIFGLLLTTALPAYRDWIAAQQLANHAHFIADTLAIARSAAIKHGYRVNLCKPATGAGAATSAAGSRAGYCSSMRIALGQVDDDTIVLRREGPAGDGITMHGKRAVEDYVSYTSVGDARLLSGALQMGTFVICNRARTRSRSCWRTADERASTRPRIAVLNLVVPFFGGKSALVRHLAKASVLVASATIPSLPNRLFRQRYL